MTRPLICLVLFAGWAVALVVLIGASRVVEVLAGRKRSNEFPSGTPHGSDLYWRLNRAQVNTVENLPIFGALVLTGTAIHVATPLFEWLPVVVLAGRLLQTTAHLASGSALAVNVRFTCFVVQIACFAALAVVLLRHMAGG
jgi:uncharacterized MAPEG superfamily protein